VVDGGAEKVLKEILDIYPEADIFAIVDFLSEIDRQNIIGVRSSTTTFIQHLPFAKRAFRNYLPLFPKAIASLKLADYDLIISSSWAFAKGIKKNKNQIHICYCHTPIRYAWDLYDEYTKNLPPLKKLLVQATLRHIRVWDINTSNVDFFIANSEFVKTRIKNTYNRDAVVIYPPINTESFLLCEEKGDYYLCASRLVPYKKTKLIVEAFVKNGKKLKVIGEGEELKEIKKIATPNIEILGYQDNKSLIAYMQKAKGFIYAALEDFGIVPVEAMSCGTPVVCYGKGGVSESVIDKKWGIHFEKQDISSINSAIEEFEKIDFDYRKISEYAGRFSKGRFKEELKSFVDDKLGERCI